MAPELRPISDNSMLPAAISSVVIVSEAEVNRVVVRTQIINRDRVLQDIDG